MDELVALAEAVAVAVALAVAELVAIEDAVALFVALLDAVALAVALFVSTTAGAGGATASPPPLAVGATGDDTLSVSTG